MEIYLYGMEKGVVLAFKNDGKMVLVCLGYGDSVIFVSVFRMRKEQHLIILCLYEIRGL